MAWDINNGITEVIQSTNLHEGNIPEHHMIKSFEFLYLLAINYLIIFVIVNADRLYHSKS